MREQLQSWRTIAAFRKPDSIIGEQIEIGSFGSIPRTTTRGTEHLARRRSDVVLLPPAVAGGGEGRVGPRAPRVVVAILQLSIDFDEQVPRGLPFLWAAWGIH